MKIETATRVIATIWTVAAFFASSGAQSQTPAPPTAKNAAAASLDMPLEGVIEPEWTEMPTAEQMGRLYPKLDWYLELDGRVRLSCLATTIGTLEHCKVDSELPAGLGFSDAALLLAPNFHFKPKMVGGVAVGGDEVNFTVVFRPPPLNFAISDPSTTTLEPSKRGLELAHQLIAVLGGADTAEQQVKQAMNALEAQLETEVTAEQLKTPGAIAAVEAFEQSIGASLAAFHEQTARSYATTYTETELADIIAFVQTPSGKAWTTRQNQMLRAQNQGQALIWKAVFADTRTRLCQKIAC